jgi:hypothetical protein
MILNALTTPTQLFLSSISLLMCVCVMELTCIIIIISSSSRLFLVLCRYVTTSPSYWDVECLFAQQCLVLSTLPF